MSSPKGMSPAAVGRRKTGTLGIGILLLVVWLVVTVSVASSSRDAIVAAEVVTGLLCLLPGAIMTGVGGRAEVDARRFNRLDWAFAEGLAGRLGQLCSSDPFDAYPIDSSMTEVSDARLVEIERHFDQRTIGNVAGRMSHQLSFFGGTLSATYSRLGVGGLAGTVDGMSSIQLQLEQTTRDNLMGDALFAVLEAPGPAGPDDTYRIVSVSAMAAAEWVQALVFAAVDRLEGQKSYAGATIVKWSGPLVAHFAPQDISYASDRLRAQASRALERRDVLTIRGPAVGRNALLAANVQIGSQAPLMLFPVQFPMLFGRAIATAAHQADGVVTGGTSTPAKV